MSKYTTELRFICETEAGLEESKGFNDVDSIIEAAIPSIFSFDFPIFDESYRNVLETKILRHYYTREIGLETYGLWKLKLQTKLNEIMPYYNKLYETELLKYNPLYDVDLTTTNVGQKTGESVNINQTDETRENTSTSKSNDELLNTSASSSKTDGTRSVENENTGASSGNSHSTTSGTKGTTDVYSDTPQGALTGVLNNQYLTNARKIDETTSGSTTANDSQSNTSFGKQSDVNEQNLNEQTVDFNTRKSNKDDSSVSSGKTNGSNIGNTKSTEDYVLHVFGKSAGANYAKLIKEFRDNLLNIDMDIISDLGELFMLIW